MRNRLLMILLVAFSAGCSGCYNPSVQDMIARADAAAATNAPAQEVVP